MQLEAIASRPIAGYLGEETNTCITTPSCQVVVESDKVPPLSLLFSRLNSPSSLSRSSGDSFSRPSPASLPFSGHAPAPQCPSWSEEPKAEHSTRGVASPVPSTGAQSPPCSCGHTIPGTSQDAAGLLGHLGTLLAHGQPAVDQHPKVLFRRQLSSRSKLNPTSPSAVSDPARLGEPRSASPQHRALRTALPVPPLRRRGTAKHAELARCPGAGREGARPRAGSPAEGSGPCHAAAWLHPRHPRDTRERRHHVGLPARWQRSQAVPARHGSSEGPSGLLQLHFLLPRTCARFRSHKSINHV